MDYTQRSNQALLRAIACRADKRRAKRFINRIEAALHKSKGRHGLYTAKMRNQTRRVMLRHIARTPIDEPVNPLYPASYEIKTPTPIRP